MSGILIISVREEKLYQRSNRIVDFSCVGFQETNAKATQNHYKTIHLWSLENAEFSFVAVVLEGAYCKIFAHLNTHILVLS